MVDKIIVFITAGTGEEAKRIADSLLDQKKAACVNIIQAVDSFFWWQGEKESAREALLIVKSKIAMLDDIIRLTKDAHSYEVPEIIAVPAVGGNQDYLDWIEREVI